MRRKLLITLGASVASALGLFLALAVYWSSSHVDESITTGERWGVRIGDSPENSLRRLQEHYGDWNASVLVNRNSGAGVESLGRLSELDPGRTTGVKRLVVLRKVGGPASLELTFVDGALTSARMRQDAFEFP